MFLYILWYMFNVSCLICLMSSISLNIWLSMFIMFILNEHLKHILALISHDSFWFYLFHNIHFFFLSCHSHNFFIMSRHHSDHFSLSCAIIREDVAMLLSCDHCSFLSKQCFIFNKFKKCSKCIRLKHSCFFSQSAHFINIFCFFCAHDKLDCDKKSVLEKHQKLSAQLAELNVKVLHLKHHQHFLKKHNDKLIQESVKILKKSCVS